MPGVLKRYDEATDAWVPHIGAPGETPNLAVSITEPRTWAVEGNIGTSKQFVPMQTVVKEGEQLLLRGARALAGLGSGSFSSFQVVRNGGPVSGLNNVTVGDAPNTVFLTDPVLLADGDRINIGLVDGSLVLWATFTVIFERIIPISAV